ncbi:hypothetical protein KJE20_07911 [Pyrenophora tritici-repentis]|nr:hypothetical protein KJE20_07911 [Pyrenophora tritici-repentis]
MGSRFMRREARISGAGNTKNVRFQGLGEVSLAADVDLDEEKATLQTCSVRHVAVEASMEKKATSGTADSRARASLIGKS